MIKTLVSISIVLFGNMMGEALATNCSASAGYTQITGSGLRTVLSGKTACKSNGSDWEWQEYHSSSGNLVDWKKGPSDPIDPSTTVGFWLVTAGTKSTAKYTYGSNVYNYNVWHNTSNNTYDFCGASTITGVTLKAGQVAC